ncbi:MAG: stage 0 sporulation family protein [Chloroflexi bacterium]|nr:stage 0 sporulation family protein [Chloroflexota bacterium]
MANIVGIRFRKAGRVYYFDPAGIELKADDYVIVKTSRGLELGHAVIAPRQVPDEEIREPLVPVVRKAEPPDIKRAEDLDTRAENALIECGKLISELKLPMKLVSADFSFDGNRLTFLFTAEQRVDFRELVRKLSDKFRVRIELRQIGSRDEAKIVGGFGRCGRQLCCQSFLDEFSPVSIKMAKEQELPLNPMKISGSCGRLMCCLAYESPQYKEMKDKMPRVGQRVHTKNGEATVTGRNILKGTVMVETEGGGNLELPLAEVSY